MFSESVLSAIHTPYLVEAVAFLLGVVLIVPLFKKIRISPIIGFLIVGALLGPHSFAVVSDVNGVQHFAELGVVFLLFTIGLELSFERLKAYSGLIFGLGSAQVVFCSLAIGLVAWFWGNDTQAAIIIGLCLSLSSTAMVIQLLNERGELASKHGRSSFAVLLFQDLAVVPILILLSIFGQGSERSVLSSVLFALVNAAIAIGVIVLLGRFGLRKLFAMAARTHSIDVFTAMSLLTILAISMITGMAGLSMALGAFLAGLLLAETEFRHQIEAEIEPFKGLLLGLFFMSVGMNIDFVVAFDKAFLVIASVLGLIAVKSAVIFSCALAFRLPANQAIRTSLLLAEGGEFAFVVIGQATLTYALINHEVGQFMVVVAGLSMMLTPVLAFAGDKLAQRLSQKEQPDAQDAFVDDHTHDHIVIAGFGRVGLTVAQVLKSKAIPYVAIDSNADEVRRLRVQESALFVGDASRSEILKRVGIERAAALLVTMDSAKSALRTVEMAHQQWPGLIIIVRSRDTSHANELMAAGATQVVPETWEASLQLSNYILRAAGFSRDEANASIDAIRALQI